MFRDGTLRDANRQAGVGARGAGHREAVVADAGACRLTRTRATTRRCTAAAASLIARVVRRCSVIQGATKGLGLDAVGMRNANGTLRTRWCPFGKRISDQVYLTYERSVSGAVNLTRVRYFLSPRWSVEAATGTVDAIDVFFTIFFD